MEKKIPWRNIDRSRLRLIKVPWCMLTDHRLVAKKGEMQKVAVDLARGLNLNKFEIEALKDVDRLYMECLRCGLMIKVVRDVKTVVRKRYRRT